MYAYVTMLPDYIFKFAWYYGCFKLEIRATCFDELRTKLHSCPWAKSSSIFMSSRWPGCANL